MSLLMTILSFFLRDKTSIVSSFVVSPMHPPSATSRPSAHETVQGSDERHGRGHLTTPSSHGGAGTSFNSLYVLDCGSQAMQAIKIELFLHFFLIWHKIRCGAGAMPVALNLTSITDLRCINQ